MRPIEKGPVGATKPAEHDLAHVCGSHGALKRWVKAADDAAAGIGDQKASVLGSVQPFWTPQQMIGMQSSAGRVLADALVLGGAKSAVEGHPMSCIEDAQAAENKVQAHRIDHRWLSDQSEHAWRVVLDGAPHASAAHHLGTAL